MLATTLLIRTLSNFKAALSLTRQGMLVEARILVRCCFENLFWVGSLLSKGERFIKEIHSHSTTQTPEALFLKITSLDEKTEEELKNRLLNINSRAGKGIFLTPKKAAYKGGLKEDYKIYSQLSADSSHPSLATLKRYVAGKKIEAFPTATKEETINTLYLACYSVLGVCALVNEIIGLNHTTDALQEISGEYKNMIAQLAA